MTLFVKKPEYGLKLAGAVVSLGPDPSAWPSQILSESYKTIPTLQDFEPSVNIDQTDRETKSAYGALVISSKSDPIHPSPFVRTVHIPIIVENGKLAPFDIMVIAPSDDNPQAKTLPLTDKRLRQALFRPDTFDTTSQAPPDVSLTNALFPPSRDGYNGYGALAGLGKMASASLLNAALLFSPTSRAVKLAHRLVENRSALLHNSKVASAISLVLQRTKAGDVDKTALWEKVAAAVPSDTYSVKEAGGGKYLVKHANRHSWKVTSFEIDRGQLLKLADKKTVEDLDAGGNASSVMFSDQDPVKGEPEHTNYKTITSSGVYRVHTGEGADSRDLIGMVIPRLVELDGTTVPIALFTNGSESALQGEIAGEQVSAAPPVLPRGRPSGYGAFMGTDSEGKLVSTVPVQISSSLVDQSSDGFLVEGVDGTKATVKQIPHIMEPAGVDGVLMLPMSFNWVPLERSKIVVLASAQAKEASISTDNVVTVYHSGGLLNLHGAPVEKLATEERAWLDVSDACFMLVAMGANPETLQEKLAQSLLGPVSVKVAGGITPRDQALKEAQAKLASQLPTWTQPAPDLVKEAAYVPDPKSVDTLLGLNLLTPDNVLTFVQKIPQIEETQQTLCELLLAARLGLQEVPAAALERAIQSVEAVLEGLHQLKFQEPMSA